MTAALEAPGRSPLHYVRDMTLTSDSDPIRVDFIPQEAHGLPGRLGLTFAPGRCFPGAFGRWERDLDKDLTRLRDHYGAKVVVSLIEEFEMRRASIPGLFQAVSAAGMRSLWHPIEDGSTPHDPADVVPLIREMLAHLAAGDTVVVHCMGGLGRAGTISACVLAARGLESAEAVATVRAARQGALENETQVEFVSAFRDAWAQP